MALYFYDNALLNKIKGWTNNTALNICGVNESSRLFEVTGDTNNDNPIQLPLISISRPGGYRILNTNKKPMTFDGMRLDATELRSMQLNAVPIDISYQIDVYCRYLQEADEYMRNIVFNIINFPKLEIIIPYYNYELAHNSSIRITSDVEDNSDISERIAPGQFSRLSISVNVDDAYLFDIRPRDNKYIEPLIGYEDKL